MLNSVTYFPYDFFLFMCTIKQLLILRLSFLLFLLHSCFHSLPVPKLSCSSTGSSGLWVNVSPLPPPCGGARHMASGHGSLTVEWACSTGMEWTIDSMCFLGESHRFNKISKGFVNQNWLYSSNSALQLI